MILTCESIEKQVPRNFSKTIWFQKIEKAFILKNTIYVMDQSKSIHVLGIDSQENGILGLGSRFLISESFQNIALPPVNIFACCDTYCLAITNDNRLYYWGNFLKSGKPHSIIPSARFFEPNSILLKESINQVFVSNNSFFLINSAFKIDEFGEKLTLLKEFKNQHILNQKNLIEKIFLISETGIVFACKNAENMSNLLLFDNRKNTQTLIVNFNRNCVKICGNGIFSFDESLKKLIIIELFPFALKQFSYREIIIPDYFEVRSIFSETICNYSSLLSFSCKIDVLQIGKKYSFLGYDFTKVNFNKKDVFLKDEKTNELFFNDQKVDNLGTDFSFKREENQNQETDQTKNDFCNISKISIEQSPNTINNCEKLKNFECKQNLSVFKENKNNSFIKKIQNFQSSLNFENIGKKESSLKLKNLQERLDRIMPNKELEKQTVFTISDKIASKSIGKMSKPIKIICQFFDKKNRFCLYFSISCLKIFQTIKDRKRYLQSTDQEVIDCLNINFMEPEKKYHDHCQQILYLDNNEKNYKINANNESFLILKSFEQKIKTKMNNQIEIYPKTNIVNKIDDSISSRFDVFKTRTLYFYICQKSFSKLLGVFDRFRKLLAKTLKEQKFEVFLKRKMINFAWEKMKNRKKELSKFYEQELISSKFKKVEGCFPDTPILMKHSNSFVQNDEFLQYNFLKNEKLMFKQLDFDKNVRKFEEKNNQLDFFDETNTKNDEMKKNIEIRQSLSDISKISKTGFGKSIQILENNQFLFDFWRNESLLKIDQNFQPSYISKEKEITQFADYLHVFKGFSRNNSIEKSKESSNLTMTDGSIVGFCDKYYKMVSNREEIKTFESKSKNDKWITTIKDISFIQNSPKNIINDDKNEPIEFDFEKYNEKEKVKNVKNEQIQVEFDTFHQKMKNNRTEYQPIQPQTNNEKVKQEKSQNQTEYKFSDQKIFQKDSKVDIFQNNVQSDIEILTKNIENKPKEEILSKKVENEKAILSKLDDYSYKCHDMKRFLVKITEENTQNENNICLGQSITFIDKIEALNRTKDQAQIKNLEKSETSKNQQDSNRIANNSLINKTNLCENRRTISAVGLLIARESCHEKKTHEKNKKNVIKSSKVNYLSNKQFSIPRKQIFSKDLIFSKTKSTKKIIFNDKNKIGHGKNLSVCSKNKKSSFLEKIHVKNKKSIDFFKTSIKHSEIFNGWKTDVYKSSDKTMFKTLEQKSPNGKFFSQFCLKNPKSNIKKGSLYNDMNKENNKCLKKSIFAYKSQRESASNLSLKKSSSSTRLMGSRGSNGISKLKFREVLFLNDQQKKRVRRF